MEDRTHNLALYLIGLALLQKNGKKYVHREIDQAVEELQKDLNLKN
ncbi:hypothetical protein GLW08_08145 [Pontibacillus yanchengensis]|uniref:Uncharacterized protein n=1 Tax=Pontibacillus yanchengensis TaxID=462910 RepID=A0ACC7VD04_9BACI|nr:hypothetical protein [Pontibacillus yanchengensis]MYL53308.1 hypothetical protein [Pontibacillus yanchengensis]